MCEIFFNIADQVCQTKLSHWFIHKTGLVHIRSHQDDRLPNMKNIFHLITIIPSIIFFIIGIRF